MQCNHYPDACELCELVIELQVKSNLHYRRALRLVSDKYFALNKRSRNIGLAYETAANHIRVGMYATALFDFESLKELGQEIEPQWYTDIHNMQEQKKNG